MTTLKNDGKHAITLIFGEDACALYNEGVREKETLNRFGKCRTFKFDTLKELNIFLGGVYAVDEEEISWTCYEEDGI